MVRTITLLECDGCGESIVGCKDDTSNREFNALAEARRLEWVRLHAPQQGLKDYCPECRIKHAS